MCEFHTKIPALGACSLQRPHFVGALQTCNKKSFSPKNFSCKKARNISEIGVEWFHVFSVGVLSRIYPLGEKSRVPECPSARSFIEGSRVMPPLRSFLKWICAGMQSGAIWDAILRKVRVVFYFLVVIMFWQCYI